jgi:hypothetical protein
MAEQPSQEWWPNEWSAFSTGKIPKLGVQPRKLHHNAETFSARKIEGDNLILGGAIEIAIETKAKAAWSAKSGRPFGTKDAYRTSVHGIVLANCGHSIRRSKGIFAGYDDVAVGSDC